jgi:type II secretory pathway component PulJ
MAVIINGMSDGDVKAMEKFAERFKEQQKAVKVLEDSIMRLKATGGDCSVRVGNEERIWIDSQFSQELKASLESFYGRGVRRLIDMSLEIGATEVREAGERRA